ncbi:type II toxin-antitoxin system VapC family toxin [Sphingomonas qomolangmaensis]|uniref:Ribonuclease VapC n=1 Tax=Sphingomonas qomolangmaensis TaxID=2918765 RepID=A0ABY5L404_9SPHN|nr:type II toxin-antitoxin system VapC family toxin [Sphingomonas qomolangmaensis]UUL81688.1 type II toxin-antitoxin system VapC family toxin [Sphingomonas qomolangmaensis]
MILFVDASALVAILAPEPDHEAFEAQIGQASRLLYSPVVAWESLVTLRRGHAVSEPVARARLDSFLQTFGFEMVSIAERESRIALDAYSRYGKGQHPARLNMGDCFAYACAKTNDARLLYKGNDFAQTDLA